MNTVTRGWGKPDGLASRLRERVRIEKSEHTPDDAGGANHVWVTHALCFAEVKPTTGDVRERTEAGALQMRVGYRITMRARTDLTRAMRVVWNGKILNIRALVQHAATTELVTEEGSAT